MKDQTTNLRNLALLAATGACALNAAAGSGTVTVTSTNYLASAAHSLTVSFGDHANVTNGLWVAYDEEDRGGDSTNGWANVKFVRAITPETDSIEYVLPTGWGEPGKKALRFFLSEVPYDVDYTLDYIQSAGKQYLEFPGYYLTGSSVVEMSCVLLDTSSTTPLFCSRTSSDSDTFSAFVIQKSSKPRWRFDYSTKTGTGKAYKGTPAIDTPYSIVASSKGMYVNGALAQECPTSAATFTGGSALTVLANRSGTDAPTSQAILHNAAKLYSFKATGMVSGTGATSLDLVPAVKAGVVGVYDTVSDKFFGPKILSGAAGFTPGTRQQESETPIFAASEVVGPIASLDGCVFKTDFEMTDATSHTATQAEKQGEGLLTLTGNNSFGTFVVNGGTLAANFGQGLGANDNLRLVSGCFAPLSQTLTAALGTGAGQINLAGGAVGFSAVNGDSVINLGGEGADVTIGSTEPTAANPLVLNDNRGTNTLTVVNRLVSNGDLTIYTQASNAVLTAGMALGGGFEKTGDGTLMVSGDVASVTFTGAATNAYVQNGIFRLQDGATYTSTTNLVIGRSDVTSSVARVIVDNATLDLGDNGWVYLFTGSGKDDSFARFLVYNDAKVNVGRLNVSQGEVQIYSGTVTTHSEIGVALGGGNEACRVYGGTLITESVRFSDTGSAFDWRGGRVRAVSSRGTFFEGKDGNVGKVRVATAMGGVFETPKNVRLSVGAAMKGNSDDKLPAYNREKAMSVAAFRKEGPGVLGFNKVNQYLCATEIKEGTLKLWTDNGVPTNGLLRLTGGTFWLNGFNQTVSNLVGIGTITNDEASKGGVLTVKGEIVPGGPAGFGELTVNDNAKLVGKVVITVDDDGEISGRLASSGILDLSDVDLVIENGEKLNKRVMVASASQVSEGGFKSVTGLPSGWRVSIGKRGIALSNSGLMLLVH